MLSSASWAFLLTLWSEQYYSISMISLSVIITLPFFCKCSQEISRLKYVFYQRITCGRHIRIAFAQNKQHEFIDIVVCQKNGFSDRPDKIRCKLLSMKYWAVKEYGSEVRTKKSILLVGSSN